MNISLLSFIISIFLINDGSPKKVFDRLTGDWGFTSPKNELVRESWSKEEKQMKGIGCRIFRNDTVWFESLRIVEKKKSWYYVVTQKDHIAPVLFELTSWEEDKLTFENPRHDFPQRISYVFTGDSMNVFVTDLQGEGITFPFKKLK